MNWRRPKADQVTPELVAILDARDGYCVAAFLDRDAGPCNGRRTIEHVREQAAMGGKRAPSDPLHCVNVCLGHIEWTRTHKELERAYLRGAALRVTA